MTKTKKTTEETPLPFDDEDFKEKWREWIVYRRQEKRLGKYTPAGEKRVLSYVRKISENNPKLAVAIIDQSMNMQWQGLFKIKDYATYLEITGTNTATSKQGNSQLRTEAAKNF